MPHGTSQLVYREVGADDIDAIRALWAKLNAYHAEMSPRFGPALRQRTFEARRQRLLAKADAGGLRVELVAVGGDGPSVAYSVTTISADGSGEIDSLFVEEPFRSQGIGAELMRRALAWLDSKKATSKSVSVMYENGEAMAFYRRFGFYPRSIVLQKSDDDAGGFPKGE